MTRQAVRKTYKLYAGGSFVRSESGRSYPVHDARGRFLANAAQASRKDLRDAVVAARGAFPGWSQASAYLRGQVLYRVAEMMEGRAEQLVDEVAAAEGLDRRTARSTVAASIDRWVWYAGWTDKIAQVHGSANPVAGPFFNFSVPEPTGVVGILAPQESSLLGFVCVLAPALATGSTAVVLTSEDRPLPALTLTEVIATSDLPPGVANVLSGRTDELAGWLASHRDVNALDLTGAPGQDAAALEAEAAVNIKRVRRPVADEDFRTDPGLSRMLGLLEVKTVWHPVGT